MNIRHLGPAVLILGLAHAAPAQETAFPWGDLKALYRQEIEREFHEAEEALKAQVFSITSAAYSLRIRDTDALGEVQLRGTVLQGKPEAIPLFDARLVMTEIRAVEGGNLLTSGESGMAAFLPAETPSAFSVSIRFVAPIVNEGNGRLIRFGIPPALQNLLRLELPPGAEVLEHPGIAGEADTYHFAGARELMLRYVTREEAAIARPIDVDSVSRISIQGTRVYLQTAFHARAPVRQPLIVRVPDGAQLLSSRLNGGELHTGEANHYVMTFPKEGMQRFLLELALPLAQDSSSVSFPLPHVRDSAGQQGRFVVEEPDDGQVAVSGEGLVTQLPVARLGAELSEFVPKAVHYMSIAPESLVTLQVKRFQTLTTASIVLETLALFCAFDESGSILSVLRMDLPPETGPRFALRPVPGAEVWSLQVNGKMQQVYVNDAGEWVLPLETETVSQVELAFLQHGEPLALQGMLEVLIPETGLAAQQLQVVVGLPERVDLLFAEGPLASVSGADWKLPRELTGEAYYFAQSFHTGDATRLAISYKEPVNRMPGMQGGAS